MSVFAGSYRMPADFAKRIKRLRQRFSLSQQQFAELIDISVGNFYAFTPNGQ